MTEQIAILLVVAAALGCLQVALRARQLRYWRPSSMISRSDVPGPREDPPLQRIWRFAGHDESSPEQVLVAPGFPRLGDETPALVVKRIDLSWRHGWIVTVTYGPREDAPKEDKNHGNAA